jgi:arylsulfatase A-like enzyme
MKLIKVHWNLLAAILVLLSSCASPSKEQENGKTKQPNILFIPVDDLRPEFGAYGNDYLITPNMDQLAEQGVTFTRTYCQEAVCNPSRASLLTGLRPDSIRVWDLQTEFRKTVPNVVTLPQYFKQNGYHTVGLGKAFHNNDPDTISWSEVPQHLEGFPFDPDAVYLNDENLKIQKEKIEALKAAGKSTIDPCGHWYVKANATEIADADDDAYYDGAQTTEAIEILKRLKSEEKPFFLSVGYYRPHLPFNAPKKYWDMYNRDSIPLAENQFVPEGVPAYLIHGEAELRGYSDSHDLPLPSEEPWDEDRQREIKHGYYASVTYTDAQIGRLLKALDELGLAENTLVVLWGDHGWKLGEHNGWCKQTTYEIDTHVPMIFSGAGVKAKGEKSNALTEFVDIYPTLCDMASIEIPDYLQGTSVAPLLENPNLEWKSGAFSQFLLGRYGRTTTIPFEQMGYAMRTDQFRYVEWYKWVDDKKGDYLRTELYDHNIDPQENKNRAEDPEYKKTIEELSKQLKAGWRNAKPKK